MLTINQNALQLACKQAKYGSTNIFPMELKHVLTNYEQLLLSNYCTLYISYEKVICMYLSHQRLSCSNYKVKVNTNIAKHCIACTLNGLSDDGTCFPTTEITPYRRLYKIILPKAPLMTAVATMWKRVLVIRNSQQISIDFPVH